MSIAGILSSAKHLLQQWSWELEVDSMICCVVWTKLCRWLWELVRWQQVLWPLLESYVQVTHAHSCPGAPDFCVDCWSLTFRFSWRVMDILLEWYFVMESYGHIAGMILCLALELVAVLFILSVMDTLVRCARASSCPPRRLRHHPACRHPLPMPHCPSCRRLCPVLTSDILRTQVPMLLLLALRFNWNTVTIIVQSWSN